MQAGGVSREGVPQRVVAGSSGFCFPVCSFSDFFSLPEYWNSLGFWLSEAQYPLPFWALRPSPSSSGGYYWWQLGRPLSTLPACSIPVHPSLQCTWAACPSVGEGGFMSSFLPGLQGLCRGDHLLPIRRPWGLRRTTQEMLAESSPIPSKPQTTLTYWEGISSGNTPGQSISFSCLQGRGFLPRPPLLPPPPSLLISMDFVCGFDLVFGLHPVVLRIYPCLCSEIIPG